MVVQRMILLQPLLLDTYIPPLMSSPHESIGGSDAVLKKHFISSYYVSLSKDLQPHACTGMLNFSLIEIILSVTATDCWSSLAPHLANVVCCPLYEASLVVLLGPSVIAFQMLKRSWKFEASRRILAISLQLLALL